MNKFVGIIDLGLSNLHNVKLACKKVGLESKFVVRKDDFKNCDKIILPGVGSFKVAMKRLKSLDLEKNLKIMIKDQIPLLGICLGMQLLFSSSTEQGKSKGLNVFKGKVLKFKFKKNKFNRFSVPHVGWNYIKQSANRRNYILKGLKKYEYMYFVHSFYVNSEDKKIITSSTSYGDKLFCSSVNKGNIFACQFHPERSGEQGLKIYKNFKDLN